jgi:hypothetical protein
MPTSKHGGLEQKWNTNLNERPGRADDGASRFVGAQRAHGGPRPSTCSETRCEAAKGGKVTA